MNVGQIADLIIAIFFLYGIIRGWFIGLAVKVGHLIALIAASITAHIAGVFLGNLIGESLILPYLEKHMNGLAAAWIVGKGAAAFAGQIAYSVLFLLVFLIALLLFNHLVHILKIVDRIPVVGTLNKFGGALLGLVTEFIIIYILCAVIFTFVPQSSMDQIGLTQAMIRETYFLQFFVR